jgi:chromosome segregation ATPase
MIAIKEDEVKKLLIQLDQLNEKFLSQRNDLRECKNRLQWIEKSCGGYIERQEDRLSELKEAKSTISSLKEEIEREDDEKDRLRVELAKCKNKCYYLSGVVENLKEQVDEAFHCIENKKEVLTTNDLEDMIRRLFAGGLSIRDVQKVLVEVERLYPGKVPVKGSSTGYLCQIKRDMRGVNRLVASILIGNA